MRRPRWGKGQEQAARINDDVSSFLLIPLRKLHHATSPFVHLGPCALVPGGPGAGQPDRADLRRIAEPEPVGSYYAGGTGGFGSGPGPNYGITFGPDTLAIIDGSAGGTGNTGHDPSGHTVAFFLTGPGDVMDKPSGFTTGFSFYYSAPFFTGSVTVWSGLDGTGTELASISLPLTPNGAPGPNYSVWVPAGVAFSGTAMSAIFSGTADYIAFDNITLGSASPAPEPASLTLLGLGACGLLGYGWRRNKAAARPAC
jgi:hypothetical protein